MFKYLHGVGLTVSLGIGVVEGSNTGAGVSDGNGVGVGVGSGAGVGLAVGSILGAGVGVGLSLTVDIGSGIGDGLGVGELLVVAVGEGVGLAVKVGSVVVDDDGIGVGLKLTEVDAVEIFKSLNIATSSYPFLLAITSQSNLPLSAAFSSRTTNPYGVFASTYNCPLMRVVGVTITRIGELEAINSVNE